MTKTAIAYIRVSTDKQGRSGLGLEAQQADIARFCAAEGFEIGQIFVEVETGKGSDALATRPQLAAAIEAAAKVGGPLVVAKLDRLTRDVHFGSGLLVKGVNFRLADNPNADNFMIHILLAVAEKERLMISQRTKAALAAAKQRGIQLGSPNGNAKQASRSSAFAESLRAIVEPMRHLPSRAIAAALNERGILTDRGGLWQSVTVLRLIDRLEVA